MYRVRNVLLSWRQSSLSTAFKRWKTRDDMRVKMVMSMRSCFKVFRRITLRNALSTWRQISIFSELRATKRMLHRSETAAESRLKVAFLGIMKRGIQKYFVVWQEHVRQTISVKKTILLVLQRNVLARIQKGFSVWKDFTNTAKFMSNGCRAVRRAITNRISNALVRAFRLWVLHVADCRSRD